MSTTRKLHRPRSVRTSMIEGLMEYLGFDYSHLTNQGRQEILKGFDFVTTLRPSDPDYEPASLKLGGPVHFLPAAQLQNSGGGGRSGTADLPNPAVPQSKAERKGSERWTQCIKRGCGLLCIYCVRIHKTKNHLATVDTLTTVQD